MGFVLFLYRVDLYNNGKYLHPLNNKNGNPRYIDAKCDINQTASTTPTMYGPVPSPDYEAFNMLFGHHIRFGEKEEVLSYDYWYWSVPLVIRQSLKKHYSILNISSDICFATLKKTLAL